MQSGGIFIFLFIILQIYVELLLYAKHCARCWKRIVKIGVCLPHGLCSLVERWAVSNQCALWELSVGGRESRKASECQQSKGKEVGVFRK